jgi:hypothetical protein
MDRDEASAVFRSDGSVAHVLSKAAGVEEANDRGFVVQRREAGQEPTVNITSSGRRFLRDSGRSMVHGRLRVGL